MKHQTNTPQDEQGRTSSQDYTPICKDELDFQQQDPGGSQADTCFSE